MTIVDSNPTPPGANPGTIAKMSKTEILDSLAAAYTESKPLNDQLVDASLKIQALTAEVYRRAILKNLPGIPMGRCRTVMKVSCTVHPNHGIPKIVQRLATLKEQGTEIVEVVYDENTGEYNFYSAPEFIIQNPPPS